mgnify:CR=1 FL=1
MAELVTLLKDVKLSVGVVILVGAGGHLYQASHVRQTVELLRTFPLDAGDVIYLRRLVLDAGGAYERRSREAGIRPLSAEELESQMREFKIALKPARRDLGPRGGGLGWPATGAGGND